MNLSRGITMTRKDIEISLECCAEGGNACNKCKISKKLQDNCQCCQTLLTKTLEYINELKAEKTQAYTDGQKELLQDMYNVAKEGKDENLTISCEDIEKIARRWKVKNE